MTAHELRPSAGARYLLERLGEAGDRASYRATIFTPDAEFSTTAELRDDGTFELAATGATAELRDHLDHLAMQARLLARGAAKRREDGLPAWPARVLRWRGPGRG